MKDADKTCKASGAYTEDLISQYDKLEAHLGTLVMEDINLQYIKNMLPNSRPFISEVPYV